MLKRVWVVFIAVFVLLGCATPRRVRTYSGGDSSLFVRSHRKFAKPGAITNDKTRFYRTLDISWPLKTVELTSKFGLRNGDRHEGIDFRAKVGTPVFSAHAGKVIYSGDDISGYGTIVVVKHPSGLSTVYAHHQKNTVRSGQFVRRGQMIGYSGNTGRSTGPHLHFEMRDGADPFDPLKVLQRPMLRYGRR